MKLLLLADQSVGTEIAEFLLTKYPEDLALIVTISENAISEKARALGVEHQVFENDEKLLSQLKKEEYDLGILAWWPNIIKSPLIDIPRLGFINTHPSLLPHNRGKHYNFWALVEEAPFGVSIHCVASGIDSGDIIAQQTIEYDWSDSGGTLHRKAQKAMVELFRVTYPELRNGKLPRQPQDLQSGSFHKAAELDPASRIELDSKYTARELLNLLRARTFEGYPACWFDDSDNRYEIRIDIRRVKK